MAYLGAQNTPHERIEAYAPKRRKPLLQRDLERLTEGIRALRTVRRLMTEGQSMARLIEVKGLAGQVKAAKQGIADVRAAASSLNESASAFAAECADVKAQIEEARSDLRFEAETLGNSGSNLPAGSSPPPSQQPQAEQVQVQPGTGQT